MRDMENTGKIDALRLPPALKPDAGRPARAGRRWGVLKFWLVVGIAILLVGGLVALRTHQKTANKKPDPSTLPIPVSTAAATRENVPLTVDGIGTVQALNTVNIKPMVDGPLVEIRFREGQDVAAGDVLARIDARTYQAALDQAVAKKAQDEANLANAQRDLVRYDKLAKTQYTTAQQADTQRATVAQDEAIVRQDQAQIDTARTNLSYTTIVSPVQGRTGIRQIDLGNIVHSTDTTPLTVVTTLKPITVVFTLPQQNLPEVTASMQANRGTGGSEVTALPQAGGESGDQVLGTGHVAVLDNQVDQNTGTIKLKAVFPNPDLRLWPGAFVNVRLALTVDRNVITVPVQAVQRGPQGAFVFTVKSDDTVARHPVTIARQTETLAVVSDGLQPGQVVVTDGASRLTDGSHIRQLNNNPAASTQTGGAG
jgi:multidrug efflux system membrane fusion protein